jgi:hypothetical protein
MRNLLLLIISSLAIFATNAEALEFKGHANFWNFYQTDDVGSTTVALVYASDGTTLLGIAVGKDIATECAAPRICTFRKIGEGGELKLENWTNSGTFPLGNIGGDSMLTNIGVNGRAQQDAWSGVIDGNFTRLSLDNRALLGREKNRFRFSDLYAQYETKTYQVSLGRKAIQAGVIVDGVSGDYYFGPAHALDSKSFGVFAGYAPDPITKSPSQDFFTFGPTFHFIPEFSSAGDTKFLVDSSLVTELYKGDVNRFYLFSRAHFTPIREFSMFAFSTLDLPWSGNDGGLKSTHFSLQNHWHPNEKWFFALGFSQFRIDRYLQEDAVRWVTNGTAQSTRVSDSLDKSHRYRIDFRTSVRLFPEAQPYLRARYERRTFDSNKTFENAAPSQSPALDLALLNRKNAYSGTGGLRLFLLENFETDTALTYSQRFQSSGWDAYQSFTYDSPHQWSLDSSFQLISSNRTIDNSVNGAAGTEDHSYDLYAGVGGSYRFLSDFLLQIRYDFSNEDEKVLDRRTTIHSVLTRLDYRF